MDTMIIIVVANFVTINVVLVLILQPTVKLVLIHKIEILIHLANVRMDISIKE